MSGDSIMQAMTKTKFVLFLLLFGAAATSAEADTLTWAGGATGSWDTTGTNWTPPETDPWDATTGGNNVAAFGGAAAVTVLDTVYTNGINFSGGTTVFGGTITLTGTAPTVTYSTLATAPARLGSQLSGSGGLTISSSSSGTSLQRLILVEGSQSNTFGDLTIQNTNTTATSAEHFTKLQKSDGAAALSGNLTIDAGSGTSNLAAVYLVTASSVPTDATVTLNSDGGLARFVLNDFGIGGSNVEIGGLSSSGSVQERAFVSAAWDGETQPTTTLTINNGTDHTFAGILQNNVFTTVLPRWPSSRPALVLRP